METNEKKSLWLFIAVAYGFTYVMGIFMYLGCKDGIDLSTFTLAQMLYPACGVILGKLTYEKRELRHIRVAFIIYVIFTLIMMVMSLLSVIAPIDDLEFNGQTIGFYYLVAQYVMMLVSLVIYILFWVAGKDARETVGLERKNIKLSVLMVILYIAVYMVRIVLSYVIDGAMNGVGLSELKEWVTIFADPYTWVNSAALVINFFFIFICFFGEEYGWRYYLQPIMMNKFGKRLGVILLGVVWGLWHAPIDFFYYTTTTGPQMLVNQIFTCISIGIFFAFAYLMTDNIWVVVILHCINNNLIPIITGNYSADVLENQSIAWSELPIAFVIDLVMAVFIFAKVFNENKEIPQQEVAEN